MRELVIVALSPLANVLTGVHPHTLTAASLLAGVLAGVAYSQTAAAPSLYLLGGALVAVSGIADGLDGIVARQAGRTSAAGHYLDHLADRFVEAAILGGLALSVHTNRVLGLSVLVLVLLHSYAGTQIEASFARRSYEGVGKPHLFLVLVLATAFLAAFPHVGVPVGRAVWSLQDALFTLLGGASMVSLVHRSYAGWKLGQAVDRRGRA